MISMPHLLWSPLQKSHIAPRVHTMLPQAVLRCTAHIQCVRLPSFVLSSTLPKKRDPQGKDEKEAKPVSHLDVVSLF